MKKYLSNTWVSYIISFVLSFMLFIYEPINLFSNNIDDFWFDLKTLLGPSFMAFAILLIGLIVLLNIIYFINKKAFNIYSIILFICFVCTYIQGNYLVGSLPALDGSTINWNSFIVENIITIILWLIIIIASLILIKKFKINNYLKYSGYISLAILIMLSVSLLSNILTNPVLEDKKNITIATFKDYNKYSNNKNFIILLVDTMDSKTFEKNLNENKEFKNTFDNFSYYPDTMSYYPFTAESVPQIITGKPFLNDTVLVKYSTNSMKDSVLLNTLKNNDYELNLYTNDAKYYDKDALSINNYMEKNINTMNEKIHILKQEIKYSLFRYLPYVLKKYSNIESMDFEFNSYKDQTDNKKYNSDNMILNKLAINNDIRIDNNKSFKFIHINGAHVPFVFDKKLNNKKNASYDDAVQGSITIIDNYLKYLKNNNIYDNSVIIIMSDHGSNYEKENSYIGRQNPMFLVKGINEKHSYQKSDIPVSYADLNDMYIDLINDKKSNELFTNIPQNRERFYILYNYYKRNHMIEYATKDKAWETDKMYETGKEYNK